jgi:hypothetical protein
MRRSVLVLLGAALTSVGIAATACSDSGSSTGPSILTIKPGIPTGWFNVGGSVATYVVGVDNNTVHGGNAALAIGGTDTNRLRFNGVGQAIKADTYRGKRIRLSAWVKQLGVVGTDIGLWMRIDGPGVTEGFDNFSSRPLLGTSDWHQVQIILDVPNDAIGIALGALMSGKGELLVDDMTFEIIPASGPTTNQLVEFTPSGVDPATTTAAYQGVPNAPSNLNFESK